MTLYTAHSRKSKNMYKRGRSPLLGMDKVNVYSLCVKNKLCKSKSSKRKKARA